jgi:hypothetical protein
VSRGSVFSLLWRGWLQFSTRSSLNADVRRILSTDRSSTFGAASSDRATNNDYWFGTISFRMEFL